MHRKVVHLPCVCGRNVYHQSCWQHPNSLQLESLNCVKFELPNRTFETVSYSILLLLSVIGTIIFIPLVFVDILLVKKLFDCKQESDYDKADDKNMQLVYAIEHNLVNVTEVRFDSIKKNSLIYRLLGGSKLLAIVQDTNNTWYSVDTYFRTCVNPNKTMLVQFALEERGFFQYCSFVVFY